MCDAAGLPPAEVLARLARRRPGLGAGHRRRGARRRRARSASARTSCRWRAGSRSSRRRTAAGLRSTVTVMFGHIETPQELAEHMRVVRALQERTGGFTEFVPLSFIPFHTQLGRTHGIEEISREENLKHTAVFRLALGRTIPNLQASWVKMGLDAATEALRWGVNDLGGTLMEESISRMAGSYHGVRLDPRGPDRRRAPRRAARPPSARRCTASAAATSRRPPPDGRPRPRADGPLGQHGRGDGVGRDRRRVRGRGARRRRCPGARDARSRSRATTTRSCA